MITQIPSMTSKQTSEDSYDKNQFDKAASDFNIALKNSGGFNDNITYILSQLF